jgi:hypothetical protein
MHPVAVIAALAGGGFLLSRMAKASAPAAVAGSWHPIAPDAQGFYDVPNGVRFALSMPVADSRDGTNAAATMDAELARLASSGGMTGLVTHGADWAPPTVYRPSTSPAIFPWLEEQQASGAVYARDRYRAMATATNLNLILQSHDPTVAPLLVWYWG